MHSGDFSINGETFPGTLIDRELDELIEHLKTRLDADHFDEARPHLPLLARENVVHRILVERAALEADPEVSYDEVNAEYQRMVDHFGGPDGMKERFGDRAGMPQEIMEGIEKSLKVSRYLEKATADLEVHEQDLQTEAEKLAAEGLVPPEGISEEVGARLARLAAERKKNAALKDLKHRLRQAADVVFSPDHL